MSLRNQLATCQNRMSEIHDEIEGIGQSAEDESRDISDEETKIIDSLRAEFEGLERKESTLKKAVDASNRVRKDRIAGELVNQQPAPSSTVPAIVRGQKSKAFESNAECYAMGRWLFGLCGDENSRHWAASNGFDYRNAQEVGTPGAGGYTVPTPLAATIIRLIEQFGIFRQFARNIPMTSMTLDVPRRKSGLTVFYPGEGNAITASEISVDQVNLVAKKYAVLNILSSELAEDAIISWTDLVATEIAYAIALAEDTNGFLGDGTATFAGITGIANALEAGSIITGGVGLWGGVTLANLEEMAGLPPAYAGFNGRWYMSRYAYFNVVLSLLNKVGGTDMRQVEAGGEMMLMGYPVSFTQILPGANGATGDMAIVFGDLSLTAMMGTRRELSIRILNELYAASDQIGVVATSRSDCVIHDVGDATNAGGLVALELAT